MSPPESLGLFNLKKIVVCNIAIIPADCKAFAEPVPAAAAETPGGNSEEEWHGWGLKRKGDSGENPVLPLREERAAVPAGSG